jgi:toxic protein SymE
MNTRNTRQVKLHTKYRPLTGNRWPDYRQVPWLNVSGVWLERAGFRAGDAVEITVAENQLIIKNCSGNGDRCH